MRGYLNQSTGDTYFTSSNNRLTEPAVITANNAENNVGITLESMQIATYQSGRSLLIAQKGNAVFSN